MSDHLKRHQDYINSLKAGKSSGISTVFGRAADILPPEAMEVEAPSSGQSRALTMPPLSSSTEVSKPALTSPPPQLKIPPSLSKALPGSGIRKSAPAAPQPPLPSAPKAGAPQFYDLDEPVLDMAADQALLKSTVQDLVADCALALEDPVGCLVKTDSGEEEVISVYLENGERVFLLSDLTMLNEREFTACLIRPNAQDMEDVLQAAKAKVEDAAESNQEQDQDLNQAQELRTSVQKQVFEVRGESGELLWHAYFGDNGISLISLADGSFIKRAEGRNEYVFSTLSASDGDIKIYILNALVFDPKTGNIFIEVNQGAYTAAFFNNGWRAHQYRRHDGSETYYVTEPMSSGMAPPTVQVANLQLDIQGGECRFETIELAGAAPRTFNLKSRML